MALDLPIIREAGVMIVAEVKERSPFGYVNRIPAIEQLSICERLGDVISIHTNEFWGGSWGWLEAALVLTSKPILAKGFHPTTADVSRAFSCGANYVLTVGWWPENERCWHECITLEELEETRAKFAVWNTRNPRNGKKRLPHALDAREVRRGWLCQASGIRKTTDVMHGMDAILVGEGLYVDRQ